MTVLEQSIVDVGLEKHLYLSTYSPGDGVTRYRFSREPGDYFACRAINTVLGRKAAAEFIYAYSMGFEAGKEYASQDIGESYHLSRRD